jgi:hypothetical protein
VFHNAGKVNRDIGCALLKVGLGITARLKKLRDQLVGFSDRGLRVADEAGLHRLPLGYQSLPLTNAELADFQCVHAGFTIGRLCFDLARRTILESRAVILGSKTIAQGPSTGSAAMNEPYNCNENEKDKDNCGINELGIGEVIEDGALLGLGRRQPVIAHVLSRRGTNLLRIHHGRPCARTLVSIAHRWALR